MSPTIAVIAQGAMGAGVGARLSQSGARVVTSLAGRSEASARRAAAAGMIGVDESAIAQADIFLSIVPPSEALALAQGLASRLGAGARKPVFVDCNAVSPPTKIEIGRVVSAAGVPFVDVGIIGSPPRPGEEGPAFYAAGPDAARIGPLADFGLLVRLLDGPVGAAAALKMSYAGITKGSTALATMMMLAASRGGAAAALRAELERSQPAMLRWLDRVVPAMFSKAYRFVGEMHEIAEFAGEDAAAAATFEAIADFYTRIAADEAGDKREVGALAAAFKRKD